MEPKAGSLVKAIYDFPTDEPSELSLLVGDIIQVKERIDKQWSYGFCNEQEGSFPIGFTVELKTPYFKDFEQLYAVANDFAAQEEGDLTLKKGDLVIGKSPIDSNWWTGEVNGQVGIFPITHVWRIKKELLPVQIINKKMSRKARVKLDMKAQIAEEMDLFKDEIVDITEEVEKGWYRGECNGRTGIFPASFVTIITESSSQNLLSTPANINFTEPPQASDYDNNSGYDCVKPYGRTIYPFKAEYANELSFGAEEFVNLIRHVDDNWLEGEIDGKTGIFPSNFVNIVVDCPTSKQNAEVKENTNNIDMSLFPEDTYGRVVVDFYPQLDGDVRLKEGDTVTLIRKIDQHWYEVVTDNGETGICPESYIEVIGSGPPSYNEVMSSGYDFPIKQGLNQNYPGKDKSSISNYDNNSSFLPNLNMFPSQNDNEKSFNMNNTADQKSNDLNGLHFSGSDPGQKSSTDLTNKSSSILDFFNDSGISDPHKENVNNSFLSGNSYENIQDKNTSNDSSSKFTSSWESDTSFSVKGGTQIPVITQTPARPPPPVNSSAFPKVTSLNDSSPPINSSRMSASSISSQSSSEAASERFSDEELTSLIQQKEQTLKIRIACKNKLENEKGSNSNNFVSNEMKGQISDLNEEIFRLTKEIADLKAQSNENRSRKETCVESQAREEEVAKKKEEEAKRREQERIKKTREQRECIITEVLQTERDYISDLKILQETFLQKPSEAKEKGIDIPTLFGNLDEVIDVASRLLRRLTKVSKDTQLIGECFVDMSDELKEAYGHYCRNHDEVTTVIDKIDPQSPAGQYLNHKIEIIKRQTNCFDLPAMLIKPVQRILKYPLLLNELLKCTEDSHPDKQWLLQATNLMTDVATAVNEFKRRKDLVFKYRKSADTSFSERISKFTIHSMAKKTSRLGMRLSSSFGLKTVTKDQDFEKVLRQFTALEKSIKIFQKDMCDYIKRNEELVTTAFNMSEEIAEFYQERKTQQEVEKFLNTHKIVLNEHWEAFKLTIERNINTTIKILLQSFCGPTNLIQKRYDKLLDFESSTSKMEKNKDATKIRMLQESQTMAKHTYEALNSQLVDDLPKLCKLSIEILYDCIRCFLKAKKNYIGKTAMLLFKLMDLPLLLGGQGSNILDTFQVKHTLVMDDLSQLTILPKELQSCVKTDSLKRNSSARGSKLSYTGHPAVKVQSPNQKIKVKSCFPHMYLYTACENFDAVDILDISLKKGDIVGIIKQQDPMGKKLRWYVDNGEDKGFVPAKCLVKFLPTSPSQSNSATNSWNNTPDTLQPTASRTSQLPDIYAKPKKTSPPQNKPLQPQNSTQPQNNPIQPIRPAPTITNSLRTVAMSRYPSVPQAVPKPQESRNISFINASKSLPNQNLSIDSSEHRYEEINESPGNVPVESNVSLMNFSESSPNVVDEFDPYSTSKTVAELYDNVPDNFNNLYEVHRYEDIPDDLTYDEVPDDRQSQSVDEYYYGVYEFSPTGPNQLYIREGQVVMVLHKCDLNSNSEWWFVEDRDGRKGYVPAAYLNKYSKDVVKSN